MGNNTFYSSLTLSCNEIYNLPRVIIVSNKNYRHIHRSCWIDLKHQARTSCPIICKIIDGVFTKPLVLVLKIPMKLEPI